MTARRPRPTTTTLRPAADLRRLGYVFDRQAARDAVAFFRLLPHVKGKWAGEPFELQPWEAKEIVEPLFGWKRQDGTRLFRECYVRVARKNGKSTLAAGIAGRLLYADREPGPEVYSAAVDREQAGIVFGVLANMVESQPELADVSQVLRRAIVVPDKFATYKVLSADAPNKHGLNASGVIVDELHAHPSRDLFDVLSTSTGAREQPIVFSISTAGVYSPDSICLEKDDYTRRIATGQIRDDAFLGVIYELGDADDWRDERNWKKANPNLGVSVSLDYLRRERDKAEASPAAQNTFRMLHCNQWVQQVTRWIDLARWDEGAGHVIEPDMAGRPFYGGLDLGRVSDLTAWVMVFPDDDGGVSVLPRFFVPQGALEGGKQNAGLYREWAKAGLLAVTPGAATDYAFVRERIVRDCEKFESLGVNADFLFQGGQLVSELLDADVMVSAMRQGHLSFALPMRELERLVLERKLRHGGNPILRWMADNVVVRSDAAGNLKPDKERSKQKIDGIVATAMALELWAKDREPGTGDPLVAWA